MKKTNRHYRQGDVFITEIEEIPASAKKRPGSRQILAAGEVTGHHHQISGKVGQMFDVEDEILDADNPGGMAYLEVKEAGSITHDEHAPIDLPKGKYSVMIQREYHPEAIRSVAD